NTLWKRSGLRRELSDDDARTTFALLTAGLERIEPSTPLLPQALDLALAHRQAVYDCIYVALAQRAGCPLVTADGPLVRSMSGAAVQVIHLDDLRLDA
ncbi:MAG: type II toxin-antitoxin system VapC family toxin, partial [Dehalococcoidia bacterium]